MFLYATVVFFIDIRKCMSVFVCMRVSEPYIHIGTQTHTHTHTVPASLLRFRPKSDFLEAILMSSHVHPWVSMYA